MGTEIISREERRVELLKMRKAATPESLEYWRAQACLLGMERDNWMYRTMDVWSKQEERVDEQEKEIVGLKAKLFDANQELRYAELDARS